MDALIGRHLYPDADLTRERLDFVQRLVQVYRAEAFCGAPIAVAPDQLPHLGFGIFGRRDVLTDEARNTAYGRFLLLRQDGSLGSRLQGRLGRRSLKNYRLLLGDFLLCRCLLCWRLP